MGFINKENTLYVRAVVEIRFVGLFLELLYIDHHYLRLAFRISHGIVACEVLHQFFATLCCIDDKSARSELTHSLFHQSNAINNEIEACDRVALGEIVGQYLNGEI